MKIRKTTHADIDPIMNIYKEAKEFMTQTGNPDQWTANYPTSDLIEDDIAEGNSYVCLDKNNDILATFYFVVGLESTYGFIIGDWINEKPYGVIHRIAVKSHTKSIGTFCLNWALEQCKNIRIDTHMANIPMQKTLKKNNYQYCGMIWVEDGTQRLAFQKSIL